MNLKTISNWQAPVKKKVKHYAEVKKAGSYLIS